MGDYTAIQSVTGAARPLAAWTYSNPALTALEYERVLRPAWHLACHVSTIPHAGDYTTMDLDGDSVIVVRDRAGNINAFQNFCRHRAARLLDGTGRCPGAIRCPYHGWTYDLDGGLRGAPVPASFADLDKQGIALKSVHVEIMLGFVFVCLADEKPPLREKWGDLLDELAPYRFEEMVPIGEIYEEVWDVDWKVVMDNYLESYHVPVGHPGLQRMFTPDYDDSVALESGVSRGVSHMRERTSSVWSESQYQKLVGRVATGVPESLRTQWRFYSMLPNLGIDIFPDQMDFFQVFPRGPGKAVIRMGMFGLPDDRREMKLLRYLNWRINREVQREDETLCARVMRGLRSRDYVPGQFSMLEGLVLQFHKLILDKIPEAGAASVPASLR
jgi:phenylpropionate dioxygenase-like ring-hydroxylating dioxygenase large terminal subunit